MAFFFRLHCCGSQCQVTFPRAPSNTPTHITWQHCLSKNYPCTSVFLAPRRHCQTLNSSPLYSILQALCTTGDERKEAYFNGGPKAQESEQFQVCPANCRPRPVRPVIRRRSITSVSKVSPTPSSISFANLLKPVRRHLRDPPNCIYFFEPGWRLLMTT